MSMLQSEHDRLYLVYPPGIEFSYRWEDLPAILSAPLKSGYLDTNIDWPRRGFPELVKPCQMLDGVSGGGIIAVDVKPLEKWLPAIILGKEADLLTPSAMLNNWEEFPFHMCVLEPNNEPYQPVIKGSRGYLGCSAATAESLPGLEGNVYWIITGDFPGKSESIIADTVKAGASLGCHAVPLNGVPAHLQEKANPIFSRVGPSSVVLYVTSNATGAGLQYAVLVYVGLFLRYRYRRKVKSVHMLAAMEGSPTAWC